MAADNNNGDIWRYTILGENFLTNNHCFPGWIIIFAGYFRYTSSLSKQGEQILDTVMGYLQNKWISKGLASILYPPVCICCGARFVANYHICDHCIEHKFQPANPDYNRTTGDTILPDGILFQHALWRFDKAGTLQDVLHRLKYKHLYKLGVQLGMILARNLKQNPYFTRVEQSKSIQLLPVPLHSFKLKKRGYNQAEAVAKGVSKIITLPILDEDAVIRQKNTRTQTGFSMQRRLRNMEGAFTLGKKQKVKDTHLLIIDDVFTTGATTFELARTLLKGGVESLSIATVAQA